MICDETRIFSRVLALLCEHKEAVRIYWDDTNQMVFTLTGCAAEVTVNFENCSHFHLGYRPSEKEDYDQFVDVPMDSTEDDLIEFIDEALEYIRTVNE